MRLLTKWALKVIKEADLSIEDRNRLVINILDKLEALPLGAILTVSNGEILINGKEVDIDKLRVLREYAQSALSNQASNLVDEQVMWLAVTEGLAKGLPPESLLFYRAALWFGEQRKRYLQMLAQQQDSPL